MVEVNGSEDILNVPLEFLAVVSAFAVFLLVVFVYVNKKWRFLNVGPVITTSSQKHHHTAHVPSSKALYRSSKIDEDYATCSSPEPSFDTDEDLLKRLRYNHHQLHNYHQNNDGGGGSGMYGSPGLGSSSLMTREQLVRESSIDKVIVSRGHGLGHTQSLQHHHHQQQQQQQQQQHSPMYKPIEVISSTLSYLTSSSQNHPSSSSCPPSTTAAAASVPCNMSSSNVKSSMIPLSSASPGLGGSRSATATMSHGGASSGGHMMINCGTLDPLMSASGSQNIRPLRVSSIRDVDDMCSRRRAHHKGMSRSNTTSGRSSVSGHHEDDSDYLNSRNRFEKKSGSRHGPENGNDLISLAEEGKVNGSSESSTSSNASADDDLHHNHNHHAHAHHHNTTTTTNNNVHHQNTLFHPHPVTLTRPAHRTIDRDTNQRPLQATTTTTGSSAAPSGPMPSTSSNLNQNHRRMAMPPRIKSVDSESPPPSEQELSTYGDSIADHDDHIFEVEDMSLVGSDLGLSLGGRTNPTSPLQAGSLEVAFDYEASARKMTVHIIQARGVPAKDIGGANNTQVRIVLLPSRKQKHKTKVRPGENPSFMESFVFSKINPEDVSSFGIRLRLYGCERIRRERLLGECILGFESLHLELETILWLNLEPRYHLTCKSKSECGSLARSDSQSSTASIQNGIPELLVGLAYNGTTGRLTVEVIKGSFFRNLAGGKAPDSYVKLVLVSSNGLDMGRAKTSLRRSHSNPLFKETFMFQVALFQISEVTLLVSLYGRKGVTRRELLGWFAFGSSSSGDEETTHWEDMCDAQGDQICRWHVLLQ